MFKSEKKSSSLTSLLRLTFCIFLIGFALGGSACSSGTGSDSTSATGSAQ